MEKRTRNHTFAILLLLTTVIASFADEQQEGAVMLKKAADAVDIFSTGPFQLVASVKSEFAGKTTEGNYKLIWINEDKWRDGLSLGGYSETRIGRTGQVFHQRNGAFLPFVTEFQRLLALTDNLRLGPNEEIKKVRLKKRKEMALDCLEIRGRKSEREVCLDSKSGVFVGTSERETYSDFHKVGGKFFPFTWEQDYKPNRLTVKIEKFVEGPLPDESRQFEPVPGQPSMPGCLAPNSPKLTNKVVPLYSLSARINRITGTIYLFGLIGTDGTISYLRPFAGGDPDLTAASMAAVRQWAYTPATCNGTAVGYEYVFTVHFSMGK